MYNTWDGEPIFNPAEIDDTWKIYARDLYPDLERSIAERFELDPKEDVLVQLLLKKTQQIQPNRLSILDLFAGPHRIRKAASIYQSLNAQANLPPLYAASVELEDKRSLAQIEADSYLGIQVFAGDLRDRVFQRHIIDSIGAETIDIAIADPVAGALETFGDAHKHPHSYFGLLNFTHTLLASQGGIFVANLPTFDDQRLSEIDPLYSIRQWNIRHVRGEHPLIPGTLADAYTKLVYLEK